MLHVELLWIKPMQVYDQYTSKNIFFFSQIGLGYIENANNLSLIRIFILHIFWVETVRAHD